MNEIWAPELLIVLFLALPLFRPFIKKFRPLDGLAWLPLIALCITIGIFPAYGFRPECLGILVFAFCMNAVHFLPSILKGDSGYEQKPLFAVLTFVFLAATAVPMFVFSPRAVPNEADSPVVINRTVQGRDYALKIYGDAGTDRPLIFIVPPEFGSASSVDLVCAELSKNNYTVVTYIRKGFDPPVRLMKYLRLSRKAAELASVNEKGKALEARRREDVESLLPALPGLLGRKDLPPTLLAGYGAGGSALARLATESGFVSRNATVLGAAAIESRLWSSYQQAPRPASGGQSSGAIITRVRETTAAFFQNLKPRRVIRSGPLPSAGLPVLYVVSDKALAAGGIKSYEAIFDALRSSSGPVALATIKGCGPLDYQDFPLTHPLYSFLLPGQKTVKKSAAPVGDTAALIGNFAALLLERAQAKPQIPPRRPISGELYIGIMRNEELVMRNENYINFCVY